MTGAGPSAVVAASIRAGVPPSADAIAVVAREEAGDLGDVRLASTRDLLAERLVETGRSTAGLRKGYAQCFAESEADRHRDRLIWLPENLHERATVAAGQCGSHCKPSAAAGVVHNEAG